MGLVVVTAAADLFCVWCLCWKFVRGWRIARFVIRMETGSTAVETVLSIDVTKTAALVLFVCFCGPVVAVALTNPEMFWKKYGRRHRICGLLYLMLLVSGIFEVPFHVFNYFMFDVILSCGGTVLTLTAAYDFKKAHSRVKNVASGPLDNDATIHFDEMIEHSFYHIINLVQIVYLHLYKYQWLRESELSVRLAAAVATTIPWLVRSYFPINSFSDNYTKGQNVLSMISVMYRMKKWQYVAYKHFLLFGLTLSVAISNTWITESYYFRLYWICLNTAYVMEFFLQTLVKRHYL